MNACVFCGYPARTTVKRHGTGELVPVCRHCVPRGMTLTWGENQPAVYDEAIDEDDDE